MNPPILASVVLEDNSLSLDQTIRTVSSFPPQPVLKAQHRLRLQSTKIPLLTNSPPLLECRISVVIPVRNEAESLPVVIRALANQVDDNGDSIDPKIYEILVLANNCTDSTVEVAKTLSACYPLLQLHTIQVSIPKEIAHVGKARQMVMDEAYRRLSLIGRQNRIIASTDGDTQVAPNWISTLLSEFDKDVDAVGGRIITCRSQTSSISPKVSLYYLRRIAHAYISAQIECFLDPQLHDCWPRHFQYYGANMAISAEMYGYIGGLPLVKDEEDVALYRQLKLADARIRHSPNVRVHTSARRTGRATGGLAELLDTLSYTTQANQPTLVEAPEITEARMLLHRYLRQIWLVLQSGCEFNIRRYVRTTELLTKSLGISAIQLQQCIDSASTFGELVLAISNYQRNWLDLCQPTTEISIANMYLRQRLQTIRRSSAGLPHRGNRLDTHPATILKALQQVQAILLFSPTYQ